MRDTIAWSYQLLHPHEQVAFRHLAVFSGGWTEEAAEAIVDDRQVHTALHALTEKSLLRIQTGDPPRYGMLETIREFGLEQLVAARDADGVRLRHARYFLELAQHAEPELIGPLQGEWLDRLEMEYDNLREALEWAHSAEHSHLGLELCVSLRLFWLVRGHAGEGRRWTARFLQQAGGNVHPALQAAALYTAGTTAYGQEVYDEAEQAFQRSLSIYRELGDLVEVARVSNALGAVAYAEGKYGDALPALEESVRLYREAGRDDQTGAPLNNIANIVLYMGDLPRAVRLYEECIALYKEAGNEIALANTLNNLALAVHGTGDRDRAKALAGQSLALYRELGDPSGQAMTLTTIGAFALDEGGNEQAEALILESLALAQESGARVTIAEALINLGTVEFRRGRDARAEELARNGLALAQESDTPRTTAYALDNLGDIAQFRGNRREARRLYEEGLALRRRVGDMSGVADSYERLAGLACAEGAWEDAVVGYAASAAIRERSGTQATPMQHAQRERDIRHVRSVADPDLFDAAWEAGREAADRERRGAGSRTRTD